jgi:hypothetical protein
VTPDERPFEGTAGAGRLAAERSLGPAAASPLDGVFEDIGEGVHEIVLDEADDDLGERALRYCFARDVDDLEKAVELYARLGFGQSVDGLLEQRLEDLWRDLRKGGKDLVDRVTDKVDDAIDDLF